MYPDEFPMTEMVRKVHNAVPLHMPADFGNNETYEDYCAEAMIAAIQMQDSTDEEIVKTLVDPDPDFGWDLDVNEAVRIVKELRMMGS